MCDSARYFWGFFDDDPLAGHFIRNVLTHLDWGKCMRGFFWREDLATCYTNFLGEGQAHDLIFWSVLSGP